VRDIFCSKEISRIKTQMAKSATVLNIDGIQERFQFLQLKNKNKKPKKTHSGHLLCSAHNLQHKCSLAKAQNPKNNYDYCHLL
jgi:hypothetical protein